MTDGLDVEVVCTTDEEGTQRETESTVVLENEDQVPTRVANLLRAVSGRVKMDDATAARLRAAVLQNKRL